MICANWEWVTLATSQFYPSLDHITRGTWALQLPAENTENKIAKRTVVPVILEKTETTILKPDDYVTRLSPVMWAQGKRGDGMGRW